MFETVFEKQGTTLTAIPSERLDANTSGAFGDELFRQLDGIQDVIMDFEHVDYISSSGLRVIMGTVQRLDGIDGSVKVIHASKAVKDVLELSGFLAVVTVE